MFGGTVVLVLPHADGLGVDLHQLRQGVLQAPCDGHGGAEVHVVLRELLRRQGAGGVDGGPGLGDDHVADVRPGGVHLPDQLHGHLLRLPAGGAVADGDVLHTVFFDEPGQGGDGLLFLPLAVGGIDHGGVQHLAGAVHHGHLAPHAVARVQAHGHLPLHRGLHQKGLQIQGELADGPLAGGLGEAAPGLPLQGGEDKTVIGVLRRGLDKLHGRRPRDHHPAAEGPQGQLPVQLDGDLELSLLLSPVDGQDLVALHPGEGLGEVVVEPVDRVLLHGRLAVEPPVPGQQGPEGLPELRVVAEHFRHDVAGPRQGILRRLHALLRVDVPRRLRQGVRAVPPLGEEQLRQGGKALLPGHRRPGPALLLVGPVQVLHLRQGGGGVDGPGQLPGQLALFLDGLLHGLPPLLEAPEVVQALLQIPEGGVVHGPVELLAVAGDEGDGVALVQEADHVVHVFLRLAQLPGQLCNDGFHMSSLIRWPVSSAGGPRRAPPPPAWSGGGR